MFAPYGLRPVPPSGDGEPIQAAQLLVTSNGDHIRRRIGRGLAPAEAARVHARGEGAAQGVRVEVRLLIGPAQLVAVEGPQTRFSTDPV
jgi:hypothetical protein